MSVAVQQHPSVLVHPMRHAVIQYIMMLAYVFVQSGLGITFALCIGRVIKMSAVKAPPYQRIFPFINGLSNQRQANSSLLMQMLRNNVILSPSALLFVTVLCGNLEGQRNPEAGHWRKHL